VYCFVDEAASFPSVSPGHVQPYSNLVYFNPWLMMAQPVVKSWCTLAYCAPLFHHVRCIGPCWPRACTGGQAYQGVPRALAIVQVRSNCVQSLPRAAPPFLLQRCVLLVPKGRTGPAQDRSRAAALACMQAETPYLVVMPISYLQCTPVTAAVLCCVSRFSASAQMGQGAPILSWLVHLQRPMYWR